MGNNTSIPNASDHCLLPALSFLGIKEYILNFEDNLSELKKSLVVLKARRDRLLSKVDAEERKGGRRLAIVAKWLLEVQAIEVNTDPTVADASAVQQRLSAYGFCSNNIISTYRCGKNVYTKLSEIEIYLSTKDFEVLAELELHDSLAPKQTMEEYSHDLDKNLEVLEVEVETLNAMINELLKRVSKEEDRGLQTLPKVRKWITVAEDIESNASIVLDESISERHNLSTYNFDFQILHYGERVSMALKEVKAHVSKGVFKVLVERAPLCQVKKLQPIFSREMLVEKIWKCLTSNEILALGVYGVSGVGKTTLLTQIKNRLKQAGDVSSLVIFIVVDSEGVEDIQAKIVEKLGLYRIPKNVEEKASEIFEFLNRKRFVLLLDGIQRKVDLEEIGVPLPSRENGCKIVFTTPSRETCGNKWVDAVEEVECLSQEESWDFFQKTVGETTLRSHPDIPHLAKIVARKCGGLPITLSLIAETMSRKKTVRQWHQAIHVLVSSTTEFSDREVPFLKFTYDNLPGETIKSCFLYCALFPKGCDISKQKLVDCWIGEGMIEEEDREIAEIKGYEMIIDLVMMGLLMENESGYGVKMHDMVLEMVLDLDKKCIKGVEWEDEATRQRFADFNNRDFRQMSEDQYRDDLASKQVMAGTKESGESATKKKVLESETSAAGSSMEHTHKNTVLTQNSLLSKMLDNHGDTTINYETLLALNAEVGSSVSELLKLLIKETKNVLPSDDVFKDLVLTMVELLSIITVIESFQEGEEIKSLVNKIYEARSLVGLCSGFKEFGKHAKIYYMTKLWKIQKEMVSFCQVQLQLLQLRNQLQYMEPIRTNFHIVNERLDGLMKEINHNNLQIIIQKLDFLSTLVPLSRNFYSVPKPNKVHVGLDWPLMKLKKKLSDDFVGSLVLSAPAGYGKTTLAIQLCNDVEIKGKFKHIIFIVVASTPNFRVIVQNLLQHNYYQTFKFENDSEAVFALSVLLEKLGEGGPILLVLDDVWHGSDSFLNNFRTNIPDYKILVTSRFDLTGFDFTFHLKPLEDKYAETLLIKWASRPYDASEAEYEDLLQKILKRCNGSPLVIEVVGSSLNGRSLQTWKGQVESWYKGETILQNPHHILLSGLQLSFNVMKPHHKECFMDMGSFLEDQKISASILIDLWEELYGKAGNSSSSSIVYLNYLNDLASQNLLKLIHLGRKEYEDGFYNELVVTQSAILRELAICQSELETIETRKRVNLEIREDNFPNWCLNLKRPINARILSISMDDSFSWNMVEMECPNVEALILNISSTYSLPKFISTMKNLKVAIIIKHEIYPTRLTNFSCLSSSSNLKRIRLEKVSITLLDILQMQLSNLKKMSLFLCSFGKVFSDIGEIEVSKALPILEEIDIDNCYDLTELPFWVSEVVSLKTLSITNCNKLSILPEGIGNLSELEVLRLCSCFTLSELPEATAKLNNLWFLDISGCFGLKKLPLEIGQLQKLKKISMRKCYRCELPDSVRNLENLQVECDEETVFLWKKSKPKMKNLIITVQETEHYLNFLERF